MARDPEPDMPSILDKAMIASRYILVVFFGGILVALAIYALGFLKKLWKFATSVGDVADNQTLLDLLHLVDSALVASLVVMVAISSYDNLVSRLTPKDGDQEAGWLAAVDQGNLKLKLATALVAISSIHLLQIFMEIGNYDDRAVTWGLAIHAMFLAGVLVLGVVDRVTAAAKKAAKG